VLASDDRTEPLNCLVREISQGGAQIRINAVQSISEPGYLIVLKACSAYRIHVVWQRGSLAGLSYDEQYRINENLPLHLRFLQRLLIEAPINDARGSIAQGMDREVVVRKFGIEQDI
jgi:hypothetical protein